MTPRRVLLLSRPRHRIRIAILDDHPIVALGVATYLRDHADFELVASVSSVDDLFVVIERGECDVALVDFYLPGDRYDGATFVRRLRVEAPPIAIVVLSAARAADAECVCHRAGANAFVEKTTPLPLIAETIRSAVAAPRTRGRGARAARRRAARSGARLTGRRRVVVELGPRACVGRESAHRAAGARLTVGCSHGAVVRPRAGAQVDGHARTRIHDDVVTPRSASDRLGWKHDTISRGDTS